MLVQNIINASAAVRELSCEGRKKLNDDAESNTAVASAAGNNAIAEWRIVTCRKAGERR